MKILHISDLHLGKSPFKRDIFSKQQELCLLIAETVKKYNIGAVLISGDIYDTTTATASAAVLWDSLTKLLILESRVPVCVISGNHDGAERLTVCSDILESCGLTIRGSLDNFDVPVSVGNADIYMLPFFERGHAEAFCGKKFGSLTEAYDELLNVIRSKMDSSRCNIVMAHCFAAGGVPSKSESSAEIIFSEADASAGAVNAISPDVFRGFSYAALGHIHKPQTIKCSDENTIIRYCGTPMKYSFSEAEQTKSFTIYDTESRSYGTVEAKELLKFRIVKGTYEELKFRASEYGDDDWVRLELTDDSSGVTGGRLRELYANVMQISTADIYTAEASPTDITAEEIAELDVGALAEKYMREFWSEEMNDDMRSWLKEAEKALEDESIQAV